jgi:hypothetical protein
MSTFNRGQSVFVAMPSGKRYEGFVKAVPGDTYTNSDGESVTLTDRFWVKFWTPETKGLNSYPGIPKTYATVTVPADRLAAR